MRLPLVAMPLALLFACHEAAPEDGRTPSEAPLRLSLLEVTPCPAPPGFDTQKLQLVGVRVRIEGHHPRGVPANYFYASLLASDGSRYLADLRGCTPVLSGAPLGPGQSAEGFLNFPLPAGKTPQTLVYAPRLSGLREGEGQVELALGPSHGASAAPEEEQE